MTNVNLFNIFTIVSVMIIFWDQFVTIFLSIYIITVIFDY